MGADMPDSISDNAIPRSGLPGAQPPMVLDALPAKAHAPRRTFQPARRSPHSILLSPLTAICEAQPLGRRNQPLTLCAYEVDLDPVFDSLDRAARVALSERP